MSNPNNKKSGKWIPLVIFLLFTNPVLLVPVAVFGGVFWIVHQAVKMQQGSTTTNTTRTTRKENFEECPQPIFCFHKDKGEHHVRRGKEIDPWDRPDIDISKYQRK